MNIQLFLENQEVELNNKIAFPLNKTFENLWNPTDIIVEYSKSINVPATAANNKLMANAYRLDRQYIVGGDTNIGMYLDPMKRIPMKLIYNGTILLDGYAKYTSATSNGTSTFYTFNLYGALGDVFQTLSECVVDANKLTDEQRAEPDGGDRYIIKTPWEPLTIDKSFVKESWKTTDIMYGYGYNTFSNIGMAPAYRGNYDDFESTSILGLDYRILDGVPTEPKSVEDSLKREWVNTLMNGGYSPEDAQNRVDALDYDMIIPNGLNEHNMRQFRSYEQKPYIYFHSLLKLYQDKCKELTGYTIKLDTLWFNSNNPYYGNLCYMFDYLSVKGNTLQGEKPFTGYTEQKFLTKYCTAKATYSITDEEVLSKSDITINSFTLGLQVQDTPGSYVANPKNCVIKMDSHSCVTVDIAVTTGGTTSHYYFWGGTGTPSNTANVGPSTGNNTKYPKDKYIYMVEKTQYDAEDNKLVYTGYLTVPSFTISHTAGDSIDIVYNLQYITGTSMANSRYKLTYKYTNTDGNTSTASIPVSGGVGNDGYDAVIDNDDFKFILPNISYASNWRNSTTCELKNIYTKDEPLFNAILQYTKMMRLIWKTDYQNKVITIMTPKTYFNNYKIVDWTDKIDKSKGLTINPVSFDTKYVTFNYEDVDGYRYSGYKNKYGVNYGEKKMQTKYNFDIKNTDLFSQKIYPSSISCKAFSYVQDLKDWNTLAALTTEDSEVNFIDCVNDDETSSISINNWYFRLPNKTTNNTYRICDASKQELAQNKYYWIDNYWADEFGISETINELPQFSPVIKSTSNESYYGLLFNCPNEDYTKDKIVTAALGNYLYDLCWKDYIAERYNANNKKVTCYVNLTPIEFEQFNYKTFVTIDNNLFVVNKIIDFDVKNNITKCELIQVTNIDAYASQRTELNWYIWSADELYITPTKIRDNEYAGSTNIIISGYPNISDASDWSVTFNKISGSENSWLYTEDSEYLDSSYLDMPIYYESPTLSGNEEYEMTITANGVTKTIPIYILVN